MVVARACKIKRANDTWMNAKDGVWLSNAKNGNARVRINGKIFFVAASQVWIQKRKKRYKSTPTEKIPNTYRYRRPVTVTGVKFIPGQEYGDYGAMHKSGKYADSVFMFNDNHQQFCAADPQNIIQFNKHSTHCHGGGNAAIRPEQIHGNAIGMPTGPYDSLDQIVFIRGQTCTVKDIIWEACERTVDLFLKRSDKDRIFYSIDAPGSKLIGLGIFAGRVGEDVRAHISTCIQMLPILIKYKMRYGKLPQPKTKEDTAEWDKLVKLNQAPSVSVNLHM